MKTIVTAAILAGFALPVIADEAEPQTPRLGQLELIVVTANKSQPAVQQPTEAQQRLQELEIVISTAPKEQPEDYQPSDRTAELLAEIEKEE
jgi:hypothetical protein